MPLSRERGVGATGFASAQGTKGTSTLLHQGSVQLSTIARMPAFSVAGRSGQDERLKVRVQFEVLCTECAAFCAAVVGDRCFDRVFSCVLTETSTIPSQYRQSPQQVASSADTLAHIAGRQQRQTRPVLFLCAHGNRSRRGVKKLRCQKSTLTIRC